jgi:hypothetical protein
MQVSNDAVTNVTMRLVKDLEDRFHQSEKSATIEVGIAIGVVISLCILSCMCFSAKACRVCKGSDVVAPACCGAKEMRVDLEDAEDDEEDRDGGGGSMGDMDGAPSVANTEGAYRSDTDSDDEGHGTTLSKEAQKRARANGSV